MATALNNLIMHTLDAGTKQKLNTLCADQKIKDWHLNIIPKREVKISDILKNGPLILTFIRGTWCPFCNIHLKNLRSWVEKLKNKKATIIVVSSEYEQNILSWLEQNSVSFLFASDPRYELADYFGVRDPKKTYFQAATFLIDVDFSIRLAYTGKRTDKIFDNLDKQIRELSN